jgi:hypothetical protein
MFFSERKSPLRPHLFPNKETDSGLAFLFKNQPINFSFMNVIV